MHMKVVLSIWNKIFFPIWFLWIIDTLAEFRIQNHDIDENHGNVKRKAVKLSVTKCEHFHWSNGHRTHLWLADKSQMNLWAFLSAVPWMKQCMPQIPQLIIWHFWDTKYASPVASSIMPCKSNKKRTIVSIVRWPVLISLQHEILRV